MKPGSFSMTVREGDFDSLTMQEDKKGIWRMCTDRALIQEDFFWLDGLYLLLVNYLEKKNCNESKEIY